MSDPLELESALRHLPHGPEFRFIDRVVSLDPGICGVAEYQVRGDEPFLAGHFPADPLFPGVLLLEAAAQLAGVVAQCDPARSPLPGLKLTAVRAVKFLGSARPGDRIRSEARIIGRMANLFQASVQSHVGSILLMQGEVTLSGTLV